MRQLTTVEKHGQEIRHQKVGTLGIIVGAYMGGFWIRVREENNRLLQLPFGNIDRWEVTENIYEDAD